MIYRALGLMSGSSLDGLDISFAEYEVSGHKWSFQLLATDCIPYSQEWMQRLQDATQLSGFDYLQLHSDYGHYLGEEVMRFIQKNSLDYRVQLIGSHGHTTFHQPASRVTHQLGDGSALAAKTSIHVISDLRSMDVALGGEGAPIVPAGERLLFSDYDLFLNLGGIANLSVNRSGYIAFDVCPANRVLNLLAAKLGKSFDESGLLARSGQVNDTILEKLNALDYYQKPFPKSLSNEFGTEIVFPLLESSGLTPADALCTYTEHIAIQVARGNELSGITGVQPKLRLLVTGGGAFNTYLVERLQAHCASVEWVVAEKEVIQFKEALIMGFLAVLRWREETTAYGSVTGAVRDSVGGCIWMGHD